MAKIIERGVDTWGLRERCPKCDSMIEYDQNDLKYSPSSGQREPESFYVICPACQASKYIKAGDVPKLVKNLVRGRYRQSRASQWDR